MEEVGAILRFAGEHGPWLAVIALLLRSSARKDAVIENLSSQALLLAHQTRNAAQAATTALSFAERRASDGDRE